MLLLPSSLRFRLPDSSGIGAHRSDGLQFCNEAKRSAVILVCRPQVESDSGIASIAMREQEKPVLEQQVSHPAWSACPNCRSDLAVHPRGSKPPIYKCPFCGAAITPIWWQRCLVSAVALVLSFAVPAALGIRGIMGLLIAALICVFPAIVCAHILVFKTIPPKYDWNNRVVTTLFLRRPRRSGK